MEVIISETYDQMSRAAAGMVAEVLNTKPDAVLGMATGSRFNPFLLGLKPATGR